MCDTQVDTGTHRVKLCDFGSAKLLVRSRILSDLPSGFILEDLK